MNVKYYFPYVRLNDSVVPFSEFENDTEFVVSLCVRVITEPAKTINTLFNVLACDIENM